MISCFFMKFFFQDQKALDEKSKTADDLKSVYDKLREDDEKCQAALKAAQSRFEAISVGKFAVRIIRLYHLTRC